MSRVDRSIQAQVCEKIDHINELLGIDEEKTPAVSLAVGVAFADRVDPDGTILADAEAALRSLKERGESGCVFHDETESRDA